MSKSRRETPLSAPVDPATRRILGFDLDADSWMGRLRGYCAGPQLGMLGPYELIATAGRGGQGLVYKARQPRTGREVALKRMVAGQFSTPEMRARFQREVESVAALSHPHIVTVYGSEEIDGLPVLVMQWVDGMPFDQWARPLKVETRPPAEILDTFLKVCAAVRHAHERGVIHRDLKPTNVLVDQAGEPHVLDFGLARRNDDSSNDPTLTISGAVLGTPAYSPPEQLRGNARAVDERSDVYSLGALLFRALTGSAPVDPHLPPTAMLEQIERVGPRSPSSLNPRLDREINAIVLKALQPEPTQRYDSVGALTDDVQRYRSGRPVLAHPPGAGYRFHKFVRRNSMVLIAAGVVTVSLVAAAVSNWVHSRRADDATARESRTRDQFKRLEANRALDEEFNSATSFETSRKYAEAEARYRDVLSRRRMLVGDDDPSIAPVSVRLANLLNRSARWREADEYLGLAFNALKVQHGITSPSTIESGNRWAHNKLNLADYKGAEAVCMELPLDAVVGRREEFGSSLIRALILQGKYAEAIAPARRGVSLDEATYGTTHQYTAFAHSILADVLRRAGDEAGALIEFRAAFNILRQLVDSSAKKGDSSDLTKMCLTELSYYQYCLGDAVEAERVLQEVYSHPFSKDMRGQARKGLVRAYLGTILVRTDRASKGEELLLASLSLMTDPNYIIPRYFSALALIEYYETHGRLGDAAHWRDCIARRPFREWLPPNVSPNDQIAGEITKVENDSGAESVDAQTISQFDAQMKNGGIADSHTVQALTVIAEQRFFNADYAGAEAGYRRLLDYHRSSQGTTGFNARRSMTMLFHSVCFQERWSDAASIAMDGVSLFRQHAGESHRWVGHWQNSLGIVRARLGDLDGARTAFQSAHEILNANVTQAGKGSAISREDLYCLRDLGVSLTGLGRLGEAEAVLRKSIPEGNDSVILTTDMAGLSKVYLGGCLMKAGQYKEAEVLLLEGQNLIGMNRDHVGSRLTAALLLVDLYESTNRQGDAAHWRMCIRSRPLREWGPVSTTQEVLKPSSEQPSAGN